MNRPVVRLLVPNVPPYATWAGDEDYTDCAGLICDFITYIYKTLASKYRIKLVISPLDEGIGEEVSPGNWSGIFGVLQRKEADVLASFYALTPDLYEIVGYPTVYTDITFSVLSGPPAKLNHENTTSVFSAFSHQFWIALILSWTCIFCLYRWMATLELKIETSQKKGDVSLIESALTFYGMIMQRGFDKLPLTSSRRLVVTGWLLAVSVLTGVIGGTFSAMLAVKGKPERIDRVEDILKYPLLRPYIAIGAGVDRFLQFSPIAEYRQVWEQTVRHNSTCGPETLLSEEFMDEVSEGQAVGLACVEAQLDVAVSTDCSANIRPFYLSKESFWSSPLTIMTMKGLRSEVVEDCSLMMTNYGGMGMQSLLWRELKKMSQPCYDFAFSKTSYAPLFMRDMNQVFNILGLGTAVATSTFVLELSLSKIEFAAPLLKRLRKRS